MAFLSPAPPLGGLAPPPGAFQEHAAHAREWSVALRSQGSLDTCLSKVLPHSSTPLSRRTATQERTLFPVACTRLILIEAPSPAYHHGMLIAGDYHSGARRRPHAILHETAPILLRHRSACSHHVPRHLEPGGRDSCPPEYASRTRPVSQDYCALPRASGRVRRMYLHLVLARRPLRTGRHSFCPGPRPLYESHPRRQGQKRHHRRPEDGGVAPRRHAPAGLRVSRRHAGHPRPPAAADASDAQAGGTTRAHPTYP